jgi:hypothetical protein
MKLRSLLQTVAVCIAILVCSRTGYAQTCTAARIIGPPTPTFPNTGGTGSFSLSTTPSLCTPTFSTSFSPFLAVTSYNQTTGVANYVVGSNPGNARAGEIQINAGAMLDYIIDQQAAAPPSEPAAPVVDMFRYDNTGFNHHFFTTNFAEEGYGGNGGWSYEGIPFHVLSSQQTGTVPLYRYYASSTHDHLYTTDFSELGNGAQGYVLEEIQCYVYPTQQSGTVPLYRYRNVNTGEHFYTTNINEVGSNPNFVLERIQAYVLP